jgi:hypothetical protein
MWQRTRWRRFLWLLGRYRPLIFLAVGAALVVAAPALKSWTASATDPVPQVWTGRSSSNSAPRNCTEARAMGLENIPRGSPYYASWLDRDNDGLACEPWHGGRR